MLNSVHLFIDRAAHLLGLSADAVNKLKQFDKEHVFEIELGNGQKFKAYRIQHSNKLGSYKGGIRFHKNVNLDEMRALATLMSLKTAAVGLPMGGAKGGVAVDPQELTIDELEELSRKYVDHLHLFIGPEKDIPAPDVNTDSQIMDWMVNEYARQIEETSDSQAGAVQGVAENSKGDVHASTLTAARKTQRSDVPASSGGAAGSASRQAAAMRVARAAFTGKSLANGGSLGREAATGRGGVIALQKLLMLQGLTLQHKQDQALSYALQGFGNVGSNFATSAQALKPNWKLVAVSDSEAAVYSRAGLDSEKLQKFKTEDGRFKNYNQQMTKIITNEEMLSLDTDVLVLAGLENAVTSENMRSIKAKYIVEMANGPITEEAYEYLIKNGKVILPDVIANAGGVIVSYLEWLQNRQGEQWTEDRVNQQLEKLIVKATDDMFDFAQKRKINLKEAAFALAIKRLEDRIKV